VGCDRVGNETMAKKKDKFDENVGPLLDVVVKYVAKSAVEDVAGSITSEVDREGVRTVLVHMRRCLTAFFELHTVYTDTALTLVMAKRYPWRNRGISRGEHLDFVWFQFLNLCYLFKEKYKLSANEYNEIMRMFGRPEREDVKAGIQRIDKQVGKFVRTRGRHMHEWYERNEAIKMVSLAHFLDMQGAKVEGLSEMGGYGVARLFLTGDIKRAHTFMEEFLEGALKGYMAQFAGVTSFFNGVIDNLKEGRGSVHLQKRG
jgi:hypothetical protein